MKAKYYGVVHKEKNSDYGISFPDFPGCATADKSFDRAIALAHEALQLHIDGMLADGETLPDSTDPADIHGNHIAVVLITVDVPVVRVKRYNIAARDADMRKIDAYLKSHGRKRDRSEFLISLALREVDKEQRS